MPECIVTSHALSNFVQNGKVAGPDEAGGTDSSSSCNTVSFHSCAVVSRLSSRDILS